MKAKKATALAAAVLAATIGIGVGTARAEGKTAAGKSAVRAGSIPALQDFDTVDIGGIPHRVGIDFDGTWEPRLPSKTATAEGTAYQHRGAAETGALPSVGDPVSYGSVPPGPESFRNTEFGGARLREGLDTAP